MAAKAKGKQAQQAAEEREAQAQGFSGKNADRRIDIQPAEDEDGKN